MRNVGKLFLEQLKKKKIEKDFHQEFLKKGVSKSLEGICMRIYLKTVCPAINNVPYYMLHVSYKL